MPADEPELGEQPEVQVVGLAVGGQHPDPDQLGVLAVDAAGSRPGRRR